jgi:hypothetical protein
MGRQRRHKEREVKVRKIKWENSSRELKELVSLLCCCIPRFQNGAWNILDVQEIIC